VNIRQIAVIAGWLVLGCGAATPTPEPQAPTPSAPTPVVPHPDNTVAAREMPAPKANHRNLLTSTTQGIYVESWSLSSADLTPSVAHQWSIRKYRLFGGKQDGVDVIEVDNGRLQMRIIPTRGMSIHEVKSDGIRLGWDSPVKEIVNPSFVNLDDRSGLGWLEGFNEWLVRCGFEFAGHPGEDGGKLLTLHGKAGNTPASEVAVIIDEAPPHRIRVRGRVDERMFKFARLEMWTEVSTEPGSNAFRIDDVLTNQSDYEQEFQLIYHPNFGAPLLEEGSQFVGAVKQLTPFDDYAAKDLDRYTTYLGPMPKYGEQVYNIVPYADKDGNTLVMLHNKSGDKGVSIAYPVAQLPHFALWKNTDTLADGYVTGLEPATGYPYNRSVERKHGRVPKLASKASRRFTLDFTVLSSAEQVNAAKQAVQAIQGQQKTQVDRKPRK
jgi:hypothetical protein